MKQLFSASIIFFIFTGICRAQDSLHMVTPNASAEKNKFYMPRENSKEYFIQKRSKLNTTAWVLLGLGTVMGVTGTILYEHAAQTNEWDEVGNEFGGIFLMAAGGAMIVTSIPIFIRAGYYKRKAMDVSANLQFEPYQSGLAMKRFPAIGLRISL